ncbi:MAG: hypothetical protein QM530_00720 [Phycisphaerales bacterium]|nr:hypothetical protein [Phycisphaerales bacterium]
MIRNNFQMKHVKITILFLFLLGKLNAQVSIVNQKGTVLSVDSSKWGLSSPVSAGNIFNKNTGNVGIGNTTPTYKLDVTGKIRATDSLVVNTGRIITLNSGSVSDSIVMVDPSTGVLKRASPNAIVREPWNIIGSPPLTPSTSNTDNVYITGNVSIGKSTNTAQLDVKGRVSADSTISAPNYTSPVQTISGTWNLNLGVYAVWTLATTNTLTITNPKAGMCGLIRLINAGVGCVINLPSNSKVVNGGLGKVNLTQTAGAVDILAFYYDGTNYYWTIGNNYN